MPKGIPRATLARRAALPVSLTVATQLHALEGDLGGRDAVVGMLALAPLTPDLKYLLGLLGDPQYSSNSLAEICMLANVLPGELMKHLAAAALLAGKVRASQKIGAGIAAVAEDVMRRAAPYEEPCHACQGIGSQTADPTPQTPNPSPAPCGTCQGVGKLRYQPEFERQKLAVDLAQLLPKSSGIQIAQINQGGGGGASGGVGMLERLQQFTDRVLYADRPTAPPVEEDPALDADLVTDGEGPS